MPPRPLPLPTLQHPTPLRYSAFDEIIRDLGVHKVEVIGDAYFVTGGCPVQNDGVENAARCVETALAFLRILPQVTQGVKGDLIQIRIGMHSGPVVAGVVGVKDPRYHVFGETVSYAEKMESHGIPGLVQVRKTQEHM